MNDKQTAHALAIEAAEVTGVESIAQDRLLNAVLPLRRSVDRREHDVALWGERTEWDRQNDGDRFDVLE